MFTGVKIPYETLMMENNLDKLNHTTEPENEHLAENNILYHAATGFVFAEITLRLTLPARAIDGIDLD